MRNPGWLVEDVGGSRSTAAMKPCWPRLLVVVLGLLGFVVLPGSAPAASSAGVARLVVHTTAVGGAGPKAASSTRTRVPACQQPDTATAAGSSAVLVPVAVLPPGLRLCLPIGDAPSIKTHALPPREAAGTLARGRAPPAPRVLS